MNELTDFEPLDAYVAVVEHGGRIVTVDLHDPSHTPILVAEFSLHDAIYTCFYHDDIDKWEIEGDASWALVGSDGQYYKWCESTVRRFSDKVLSAPSGNVLRHRFAQNLVKDIVVELDNQILAGLRDAIPAEPAINLLLDQGALNAPRKLKAKWTRELGQELIGSHYVGHSRRLTKA